MALFSLLLFRERIRNMTKSLEVMNGTLHNPKHPFRQTQSCQGKPRKNRYERRKIKGMLRTSDWSDDMDLD